MDWECKVSHVKLSEAVLTQERIRIQLTAYDNINRKSGIPKKIFILSRDFFIDRANESQEASYCSRV